MPPKPQTPTPDQTNAALSRLGGIAALYVKYAANIRHPAHYPIRSELDAHEQYLATLNRLAISPPQAKPSKDLPTLGQLLLDSIDHHCHWQRSPQAWDHQWHAQWRADLHECWRRISAICDPPKPPTKSPQDRRAHSTAQNDANAQRFARNQLRSPF